MNTLRPSIAASPGHHRSTGAGLVVSWRAGRRILYQRTALATGVIAASDGPAEAESPA